MAEHIAVLSMHYTSVVLPGYPCSPAEPYGSLPDPLLRALPDCFLWFYELMQ